VGGEMGFCSEPDGRRAFDKHFKIASWIRNIGWILVSLE
jgi:hypothetical protein